MTEHGRIENAGITRHPIQAPQPGLGIKKPQGETLKELAFLAWELGGRIRVHIGGVAEDFRILIGGFELRPLLAVFQSFVEVAIMHLPFPDQEIELGRRVSGGSWEMSSPHAKNLTNGRRFFVSWSRMVPRSTGYFSSIASIIARTVAEPLRSTCISSPTWASVRK